ncbi:MAG: hypothetical protein DSY37_00560 [Hyperthermus sp.]|nr:MAG: hypothetical protein DSY37_00560 [Hyperthermus sp.]
MAGSLERVRLSLSTLHHPLPGMFLLPLKGIRGGLTVYVGLSTTSPYLVQALAEALSRGWGSRTGMFISSPLLGSVSGLLPCLRVLAGGAVGCSVHVALWVLLVLGGFGVFDAAFGFWFF